MKKFLLRVAIIVVIFLMFFTLSAFVLRRTYPIRYREYVTLYYDDWRLVLSLIKAESDFHEDATSNAGACGLMQLLPETAKFIATKNGIDKFDLYVAEDNIRLGCLYLKYLETRFVDLKTVLAAYNAGEGKVREWLKGNQYSVDGVHLQKIPYTETKKYVEKIEKYYKKYKRIYLTN